MMKRRTHETAWTGVEYCDQSGAEKLKRVIESYWSKRGYRVTIHLVDAGYVQVMRSRRMDIRSDMVNGFPVKRALARAA